MSNNTTSYVLADDIHVLPAKRSGDDDQDDELLDLPPPSKRERMDPSYHFGPQDEHGQEEAVDFAMQLLDGQIAAPNEPSLEFSVAPHRDTIGLRSGEFVSQICASVKACELPAGDPFARAPIDIVVALDVSGSMRVEKLDLCKTTLKLLLRELHHNDRFCLISFSDEAKVEVPMLKVNEEQKLKAMHTIEHMHVRGRTNIASAISLASQVANGVKDPNKVRSVFLLTDGNANVGFTEHKDLIDLTGIFVEAGHNPHTPPISLHTFGYGAEPDGNLLRSMAKVTSGGSFYAVRDNDQVASAFGDALGGILSVVAQNVTLTISVPEVAAEQGTKIITVHHEKKTEISEGVFQVNLGDVYAEEARDIMFEVLLATPRIATADSLIPHAIVELSYVDTINHSLIALSGTCAISRPNSDDLAWPNQHVAVQWLRVRSAKVIQDAQLNAKNGDVDKAKTDLQTWIDEFNKEKFEIGAQEDPLVEQLLLDLMESLDLLKKTDYDAYAENDLGVRMQTHFAQRCSEPIGKRNVYRTASKTLRSQAFHTGRT